MHMAFELAGNRSHVTFIGTPHNEITFTAKEWELLNRKEFKMTGSWMSYSAPFPGRGVGADGALLRQWPAQVRPGAYIQEVPAERGHGCVQALHDTRARFMAS